jgi:hypothetical protein
VVCVGVWVRTLRLEGVVKKNFWWYLKRANLVLGFVIGIKALLPAGSCPDLLSAPVAPMHLRIAGQMQVNGYVPTATETVVNGM